MIGQTISHYKIIEKLGEGGMGVVYKAEDTKLERPVALKFLPPELTRDPDAKRRFVHEAKAASALQHNNICTIHEIDETPDGRMFICMDHYDGVILKEKIKKGPLKVDEAIDFTIQVAEGLVKAHEHGLVHRDIKPANIIVTTDGVVKILDFGLAKLAGQTRVTKPGTTVGTVSYMSPEQASGGDVDHRSDIFSLGVVCYELLTGHLPFEGDHEAVVLYSILNVEPKPVTALRPEVPETVAQVVRKLLRKNPFKRYANVDSVLADLRSHRLHVALGVSELPSPDKESVPSVAVLPFTNVSADEEQQYFCDGMTEEITNALSHVGGLRVVARTSAFSFRGKEIDIREIGRKLNVETLLEGSVRKAGNHLRITAQLIDVADGYHIWSERYDREMADVFAIQDEISLAIAGQLKLDLLKDEKAKLVKRHTDDIDAYHFYLKGRYFWNKRTEPGLERSIENFQLAIEKDPEFALAYAGLADSYATLGWWYFMPKDIAFERARVEVEKALEIDETVGEAHVALANINIWCDWDWVGAEREYARALALNPSDAEAHHMYAHYLEAMGRCEEAGREMKRALEFEPLSININSCLGKSLYFARKYDEAIEQLEKSIEMDPNYFYSHAWLGLAYTRKGMCEKAIEGLQKGVTITGITPIMIAALGHAYAVAGKSNETKNTLDQLMDLSRTKPVDSYFIAWIYSGLGEKEYVFQWLEKAYEERSMYVTLLKVDPLFDGVRSDARFLELLSKMGLDK